MAASYYNQPTNYQYLGDCWQPVNTVCLLIFCTFQQIFTAMKMYTNRELGIEFPLQDLEVYNVEGGWIVLKHPVEETFLSIKFCNHFFGSPEEVEEYIKKEIQLVADAKDLQEIIGINRKNKDTIIAIYTQLISKIAHWVYIGVKLDGEENSYWYMAVTKDESMNGFCESIFLNSKNIPASIFGHLDKTAEEKFKNRVLHHVNTYNSDWVNGETSTEKSFHLNADNSFKYTYSNMVSIGNLDENTNFDEGWGKWEIQNYNDNTALVLKWHLKGITTYQMKWEEPGIVYLDNERFSVQ